MTLRAKSHFAEAHKDVPGRNLKNRRVFPKNANGVPNTYPAWKHDQIRVERRDPNAKASLNARIGVKNDNTFGG